MVGWLVWYKAVEIRNLWSATSDFSHSWYLRNEQTFWAKLQGDKASTLATSTKRPKKVTPTKGHPGGWAGSSLTCWHPGQASAPVALLQPAYGSHVTRIQQPFLSSSSISFLIPESTASLTASLPCTCLLTLNPLLPSQSPLLIATIKPKVSPARANTSPGGSWDKHTNSKCGPPHLIGFDPISRSQLVTSYSQQLENHCVGLGSSPPKDWLLAPLIWSHICSICAGQLMI